jgi:hypothetical protein
MRIVRTPRSSRFTVLSNALLEDARLSFKARGLLAYLLSRPDGWQTSADELARHGPNGRAAILSGLKELEKAFYLKRTRVQDGHGRWSTVCEVSDTPTEVRFSDVGSSDVGKPASIPKDDVQIPPRRTRPARRTSSRRKPGPYDRPLAMPVTSPPAQPHVFDDDGTGNCTECPLPQSNSRVHPPSPGTALRVAASKGSR